MQALIPGICPVGCEGQWFFAESRQHPHICKLLTPQYRTEVSRSVPPLATIHKLSQFCWLMMLYVYSSLKWGPSASASKCLDAAFCQGLVSLGSWSKTHQTQQVIAWRVAQPLTSYHKPSFPMYEELPHDLTTFLQKHCAVSMVTDALPHVHHFPPRCQRISPAWCSC